MSRFFLLHKPIGVTTSAVAEKIRDPVCTVYEVLANEGIDIEGLGCVGRLDQETSGALLLTDDGKLNRRIRGARSCVEKVYRLIVVSGSEITAQQIHSLAEPLDTETLAAGVESISLWEGEVVGSRSHYHGFFQELKVTLVEGKHRQIRRLCTRARLRVDSLARVSFGPVLLGDLPTGKVRPLTSDEISILRSSC